MYCRCIDCSKNMLTTKRAYCDICNKPYPIKQIMKKSVPIEIDDDVNVNIKMTLTSPACPVAGSLPPEVENKVKSIPEVNDAKVELVWSPPWDKDMMSEVAKVELGFM